MKFCLITIIKNEHKYLDEWLRYHLNLGIDKIFVYEDDYNESLTHKEICDKYNNVILNKISSISKKTHQIAYFKIILKYLRNNYDYDWVFYLDNDEFLTFENNTYNFENVFSKFNEYDYVKLCWQNYNANGHIYSPQGNVIDNYTEKCQFLKILSKSGANSKLAVHLKTYNETDIFNHHRVRKGNYCKTNFGKNNDISTYDKIYIRHYVTKSFEDYIYKIFIRGQFYGTEKIQFFFDLNPNMNVSKLSKLYRGILDKLTKQKYLI